MDISTIYKFNKLIKSYNNEMSDTKKKNISKNITKQVLNLKKNNKDRTKILNSYRKWLKNNNTAKSIQTGGGDEIYQNIVNKLGSLKKNATKFAETITNLKEMFNNPSTAGAYKTMITNLQSNASLDDIMKLFTLFNKKNLLGNIIQNYYAIFNNNNIYNILQNEKYSGNIQYFDNSQFFNDVIFSKIATGTFYDQKPNETSKDFYNKWNVNAKPPTSPTFVSFGTASAAVPAASATVAAPLASAAPAAVPAAVPAASAVKVKPSQPPPPPPPPKKGVGTGTELNLSIYKNMLNKGIPPMVVKSKMIQNGILSNYKKMINNGIPPMVVKSTMTKNGINKRIINSFIPTSPGKPKAPPAPPAPPTQPKSGQAQSQSQSKAPATKLAEYEKMIKLGVPLNKVQLKMERNGMTKKNINSMKPNPPPPK